ncbi:MAG: twin-arginine translocase subunit TatC [Planctomycetaceae bacterium]
MAPRNSKDLFDESTMSFGDHLEVLRVHLFKALIGLVVGVLLTLIFGDRLVAVIRSPIDDALRAKGISSQDDIGGFNMWDQLESWMTGVPIYDGRSRITGEGIQALASFPSLREIDLAGTNATTSQLQALENARPELLIQANAVAVAGLADLVEFGVRCQLDQQHQVTSVALSGPEIHDEHLEQLDPLRLEHITALDLRDASISDEGLKSVVRLGRLERLNLTGTTLTDDGIETLVALGQLKTLLVSSPQVTDAGLQAIARLTQLEELNLVGTAITDDGLALLAQLKSLKSLAIAGQYITDIGLAAIATHCTDLVRLELAGTQITDNGLAVLKQLPRLEVLNLNVDARTASQTGNEAFVSVSEQSSLIVYVRPSQLAQVLHRADPKRFDKPEALPNERPVPLQLVADEFATFRTTTDRMNKPITLNVQEAFMTYLKVALIGGIVLTSPWIFYQIWQFVAAGLYPNEQRYVYVFLPFSLVLFLSGITFCFYLVFPFVLSFLLGFNDWLGVTPQIRLSEWISFAVLMPLLFGVSFQLPLVMLFLERLSIFDAKIYREKRRIAILVIAIASMMLTPADPASMILMMIPLVLLYELGIWLCQYIAQRNPFQPATL